MPMIEAKVTMQLPAEKRDVLNNTANFINQKTDLIKERHRHRYEFNNKYREMVEEQGLTISGTSPDGRLVEMVENRNHRYFIAGQFHPEFKSRPDRPGPLFAGLIKAAKEYNEERIIKF